MDAEELKHVTELGSTHLKRLRILELQAAKQGTETPASVRLEIEELRDTIADIDRQLAVIQKSATVRKNPKITITSAQLQQVEVVFKGNFDSLTSEVQDATIRALAALVNISPEQITVLRVMGGSVIFHLEMPRDAAQLLMELFTANDPIVDELGVEQVSLAELNTDKEVEQAFFTRGELYRHLGDDIQAIRSYLSALSIAHNIGDQSGAYAILGVLGSLFLDQGRILDAIACFNQVIHIAQELGDREVERAALNSLVGIYRTLSDQDEQDQSLDQLLRQLEPSQSRRRDDNQRRQ